MLKEAPAESAEHIGFIRRLLASETYLLREHLQRLDGDARHRRFGHDVSDDFISRYAAHAGDFGNVTFGYFVDGEVRAVAELRPDILMHRDAGEVAFSVERPFINRGIATQLMGRIILTARNRGLRHLYLICLPDNAKMQAIASLWCGAQSRRGLRHRRHHSERTGLSVMVFGDAGRAHDLCAVRDRSSKARARRSANLIVRAFTGCEMRLI
jgi:RimJ/RimL family protein N-acetyltransferase